MNKETTDRIKAALAALESDHVQKNKFRMGILGSQDIDIAVANLKEALRLKQE